MPFSLWLHKKRHDVLVVPVALTRERSRLELVAQGELHHSAVGYGLEFSEGRGSLQA